MNDLHTLSFTNDDLDAVLALFSISFNGRQYSKEYYQWRVLQHPAGISLVELCKDSRGELISHYAVCPARSFFRGTSFTSALSLVTMTHPQFAGQGLFPKLAELLYHRMNTENNVSMVYGFPNTNSHYSFATKLKWQDVYLVPTLRKNITNKDSGTFEWKVLPTFDERFDLLWENFAANAPHFFANARNAEFLQWRFVNRPQNNYTILTLADGPILKAYAIIKEYINEAGERELDLVDYLLSVDIAPLEFLKQLSSYAFSHQFAVINSWMPYASSLYQAAEKNGFLPKEPVTYLGYRTLNDSNSLSPLQMPSVWYLTMADSDIY